MKRVIPASDAPRIARLRFAWKVRRREDETGVSRRGVLCQLEEWSLSGCLIKRGDASTRTMSCIGGLGLGLGQGVMHNREPS